MRLWTIHPKYLDTQGLTGLWREGLLAQAVLAGKTKGYREHPQLIRFVSHPNPSGAVAEYLLVIYSESQSRGYNFDRGKINTNRTKTRIPTTRGQLMYEWDHLLNKLKTRSPEVYKRVHQNGEIFENPLFEIIPGAIERWERL